MSYIGAQPQSAAFLTDTFSGNGSTTTFTLSVAPATTSSILVTITGVVQDPAAYSINGTTLTFSGAPPSGTGNISVRYLGLPAQGVASTAYRTKTEFTATASQTTFSVPSYTVGYIDVYRNGVKLGSADYTASNGVSVVLASPCAAGDAVEIVSFYVSSVVNALSPVAGVITNPYLASEAVSADKLDSSVKQLFGMRNKIINGNFEVWQRGTSGFTANSYGADRWLCSNGTESYSRGSTTPPQGSRYYVNYSRTTATSGSLVMNQRIESSNSFCLDGKTVTLSFWFRQTSGTTTPCKVRIDSADAADNFSTITTRVAETTVLASPSASWQKVTYSFTVDSISASNGFQVLIGNLATTGPVTFQLAQVQLEEGSIATPFEHRPYGTELALCQRYYQASRRFHAGISAANQDMTWLLPVQMRAAPSITWVDAVGNVNRLTTNTGNNIALNAGGITATTDSIVIQANTASTYVWYEFYTPLSAEL